MINYLKSKNILTTILSIKANEDIILSLIRLSDVVFVFKFKHKDGKLVKIIHMWRRERDPYIATEIELKSCIDDVSKSILFQAERTP
ncbi:MAG: hypothetical protein QXV06_07925 [Ignisphaera sp.]